MRVIGATSACPPFVGKPMFMKENSFFKRRLITWIAVGIVCLCLVAIALYFNLRTNERDAIRIACQRNLQVLYHAVLLYQNDHKQVARDLHSVMKNADAPKSLAICPGCAKDQANHRQSTLDYILVDWSSQDPQTKENTEKYPLIFDARLSNHQGGVNVIMLDGSAFWDAGAKWLRTFASEHPEISITVPGE